MEGISRVTLNKHREIGQFCNLTLILEGVRFRCHRSVLIQSGGSYFACLLSKTFMENKMETIELEGLPSEGFNEVLNYIYTDEIYFNRKTVYGLLILSDYFLLSKLKDVCTRFIGNEPIIGNVLEIYSFAYLTKDEKLLNAIRGHLLKNFERLITTEIFLNLRFDVLKSIYQEKNVISLGNENIVFNTAINWFRYDKMNRAQALDEIPELIMNVSKVHAPYMKNLLAKHELFKSKCSDLNIPKAKVDTLISNDLKKFRLIISEEGMIRSKRIDMIMRGSKYSDMPSMQMADKRIMVNTIDDMIFICGALYRGALIGLNPSRDLNESICITLPHAISPIDYFLVKSNLHLLVARNRVSELYRSENRRQVVDLLEFDLERNSWSHVFTGPPGFGCRSVIANNNTVYFFGDNSTGRQFGFMDFREQIFHPLCSPFSPRYNAASCIYEKKLYLAGGSYKQKTMEVFDMAGNKWYKIFNPMPPAFNYKMQVAENTVHIYGGLSSESIRMKFLPFSHVESYPKNTPKYIYRVPLSALKFEYDNECNWEKIIASDDETVHDSYAM